MNSLTYQPLLETDGQETIPDAGDNLYTQTKGTQNYYMPDNDDDEYPPFVVVDQPTEENLQKIAARYGVSQKSLVVYQNKALGRTEVWLPEGEYYVRINSPIMTFGDVASTKNDEPETTDDPPHSRIWSILRYYYGVKESGYKEANKNLRTSKGSAVTLDDPYPEGTKIIFKTIPIPFEVLHQQYVNANLDRDSLREILDQKAVYLTKKMGMVCTRAVAHEYDNHVEFARQTNDISHLVTNAKAGNYDFIKKVLSKISEGSALYKGFDDLLLNVGDFVPRRTNYIKLDKPLITYKNGNKIRKYVVAYKSFSAVSKASGFLASVVLSMAMDGLINYLIEAAEHEAELEKTKAFKNFEQEYKAITQTKAEDIIMEQTGMIEVKMIELYEIDIKEKEGLEERSAALEELIALFSKMIEDLEAFDNALKEEMSKDYGKKLATDMLKAWVLENAGDTNADAQLDTEGNSQDISVQWKKALTYIETSDPEFTDGYSIQANLSLPYFQLLHHIKLFGIKTSDRWGEKPDREMTHLEAANFWMYQKMADGEFKLNEHLDASTNSAESKADLPDIKERNFSKDRGDTENYYHYVFFNNEIEDPDRFADAIVAGQWNTCSDGYWAENVKPTIKSDLEENPFSDSFMLVPQILPHENKVNDWIYYTKYMRFYYKVGGDVSESTYDFYGWYNPE